MVTPPNGSMMTLLDKLLEKLLLWLTDTRASRATKARLSAAIDLVESHGFEVHYYRPDFGCQDVPLAQAFDNLRKSSFIVSDKDGLLVGKRTSTKKMSSEDAAQESRRRFFLVKDL